MVAAQPVLPWDVALLETVKYKELFVFLLVKDSIDFAEDAVSDLMHN